MAHDHSGHQGMDNFSSTHNQHVTSPSVQASMDHSKMGGMSMSFHFGYEEKILFEFWKIDTIGGLIGSMIGIFLMSMLYEGLKVLREYLLQRTLVHEPVHFHRLDNGNGMRVPLANNGNGADTPDGSTGPEPVVKTFLRPHPCSFSHTLQTFLHMVQIFISYLLMLIFMTYNVWLCIAVILGSGVGYFLFGWRKRTVIDINEHCH